MLPQPSVLEYSSCLQFTCLPAMSSQTSGSTEENWWGDVNIAQLLWIQQICLNWRQREKEGHFIHSDLDSCASVLEMKRRVVDRARRIMKKDRTGLLVVSGGGKQGWFFWTLYCLGSRSQSLWKGIGMETQGKADRAWGLPSNHISTPDLQLGKKMPLKTLKFKNSPIFSTMNHQSQT